MLTARTFLVRGLLAGLIAGVVTFGVAYVIGEPSINAAIAIEEAGSAAVEDHTHDATVVGAAAAAEEHSHGGEAEVSRENQSTWGLATATILIGVALGGIAGLGAAFACGRFGRLSPRAGTAVVAAIGFVSIYLVPFLKYPPNPPAVGNPDTIGQRTAWYFAMLAVSVVAAVAAVVVACRLTPRLGSWPAGLAAGAGYLVVVLVTAGLLPSIDEVPDDFPADLLWEFRTASLAVQLTLWLVIGVALATMIGSAARKSAGSPPAAQLAGTAA
ncbi:MAG TPA: CbtA family protein [Nakamurella sp.]|jgi:predicted cobalt transporter CbtA